MKTLIIATRNKHKVEEIKSILGANGFRFLTLDDLPDAPPIIEDGKTFAENAAKKSVGLVRWIMANRGIAHQFRAGSAFVLADDSGLEVDALNGAPGVHSARYAALDTKAQGNSPDGENNAKLMRLLGTIPLDKRTARFRCVLALTAIPAAPTSAAELTDKTRIFSGACEGTITDKPSGQGGFGYDPLFVPEGYPASFAELGDEIKNQLSHRAKALMQLQRFFR